jgi:hypothetical protein
MSRCGSFKFPTPQKFAKFWLLRTKMGISKDFGN